jgi:hypothetical protein
VIGRGYIVDQHVNRLGGFTVAMDNEHNAYLWINLMEDCVEAAQAASKVLRFGIYDRYQLHLRQGAQRLRPSLADVRFGRGSAPTDRYLSLR